MPAVSTIAITGSASGIGAATAARLRAAGHTVIGIDRREADVVADLGTPEGREAAVAAVAEWSGGTLDGLVTCAGLGPLPSRPGSAIVSVNYFGTVVLLERLRPLLAAGTAPAAVAISSNSVTTTAGIPLDVVEHCLAGDEEAAREAADAAGGLGGTYQASKLAVARWVRRHAVQPDWIGTGIRLNAVAPGMTETAMIAEGRADPTLGPLLDRFPIPAGRTGRPDEIASVIAFLLGPDSSFLCGSMVFVDGGTDALLCADDWPAPLRTRPPVAP